ncbi:MAG: hypothetical protein CBR30_06690 [Dictyoglomus sp. NZ13-RE01]|nr:MAG: hypothetical protein CBR30_06690 [Dictyoglomus sp. NZ13-RE01]
MIDINVFLNFSKEYFKKKEIEKKKERRKRGRPKIYPDHLILTLLFIKSIKGILLQRVRRNFKEM